MDVASILVKMRQPVEDFSVEVRGERAEEHPKRYTSLEVVYHLKGDLDERRWSAPSSSPRSGTAPSRRRCGRRCPSPRGYVIER